MSRSDETADDRESDESRTTDGASGVGRRSVLGGIAAGAAAPIVADAAVPSDGLLGSVAAAERPPAEAWESSPTDSDLRALTSQDGLLIAQSNDALVSIDRETGDPRGAQSADGVGYELSVLGGSPYLDDDGVLIALDPALDERWSVSYEEAGSLTLETGRREGLYVASGGRLEALSEADGSSLWSIEPPNLDDVENVTENLVLTTEGGSDREVVGAYDRSNGSMAWRTGVASDVSLTQTSFGEERVYYGYGNTIDAIDVSDGTTAWSREFEQGLPFIFELFGTAYLFGQGKLAELSPEDGSEVWTVEFEAFPFPNDLVGFEEGAERFEGFIVSTRSTVQRINLDGTREWSYELSDSENYGSADAVGGLVYAADGDTLVELDAGEETWTYENAGTALRAVTSDEERVYTYDAGTIYAFEHGIEGVETTTTPGGDETTTTAGGGGTTTAGGGGETTAPSGGTTVATATDAPDEGTTEAMGTDATTGEGSGGDGTATAGDSDDGDDDGSDGGSVPGFGVVTTLAAAVLAATRLLGDEDDTEE